LVQPDLRVLVEFALFPHIGPATVAAELQQGAVQGVNDALADVGLP
jgi:hypothetical protein